VVLAGRQNAARESRGASSRSPSPNLLLLPRPGSRTHWHAARRSLLRRAAWMPLRSCVQEAQAGTGARPRAERTPPCAPPYAGKRRRPGRGRACRAESANSSGLRVQYHHLTFVCRCVAVSRNVLDLPEDPGAVDVEDGVPPPRAAPPLLRRVVLNRFHDLDHSPTMGCRSAAFLRKAHSYERSSINFVHVQLHLSCSDALLCSWFLSLPSNFPFPPSHS
jgi:hypothetical protein